VSEALAHLTRILYNKVALVTQSEERVRVHINAVNAQGSGFPPDTIVETTAAISTFDPEWSYHKILERVKATCFSQQRHSIPNYKWGPFKVVEHFQVKIIIFHKIIIKKSKCGCLKT